MVRHAHHPEQSRRVKATKGSDIFNYILRPLRGFRDQTFFHWKMSCHGSRLPTCPAEQIDHRPVERRDIVRLAARHEVAVGYDFLTYPLRAAFLRSVLGDGHEAMRRPRAAPAAAALEFVLEAVSVFASR
jgi:hypothetical protein